MVGLLLRAALFGALTLFAAQAGANPEGATVAHGAATVTNAGTTTTVRQTTAKALLDWRSFDIAPGEKTQFLQPSAASLTVNRIHDTKTSRIDGDLSANGNLVLLNPNGILFGQGSRVDVNSLVASTAKLDEAAFLASRLEFDAPDQPAGTITNYGQITARDAGLVALVAPQVQNGGLIQARLGRVDLASGDGFAVDLAGDGLIRLKVSDAVTRQLIHNTGQLEADGGRVVLTAAAARDVIDSVIVNQGTLRARSQGNKTGTVRLFAEGANAVIGNDPKQKGHALGSSAVLTSGVIDASGYGAGETGGKVRILADDVGLLAGGVIDASGDRGGGDIRIGGDYLGTGTTPTAANTLVEPYTLILNNAITRGDGGRTILWSDGTTVFAGEVYGRGGEQAGNGGFVETSGHGRLDAAGFVDLTAPNGERGLYFLDPTNIAIYGNVDPAFQSTGGAIDLSANLKLWLDAGDTGQVTLTYSTDSLAGATATGTSGTNTITTSSDVSAALAAGARVRLGTAGAVTTADTLGADTYTVASVSGTTITLTGNLTQTYTGSGLYRGLVSQVADKSGQGNSIAQATAGNMPLWVGSNQSGYGTLAFDGATRYLTNTGMVWPNSNYSLYAVTNLTASNFYRRLFNGGSGGGDQFVFFGALHGNATTFTGSGAAWNDVSPNAPATSLLNVDSLLGMTVSGSSLTPYVNGAAQTGKTGTTAAFTGFSIGGIFGSNDTSQMWGGTASEFAAYDAPLAANARNLFEQYQSAKRNIALTPPGAGATEAAKATAADGYSVFSTRYLERLSQSADIALQATNNITLDLKGDALTFSTAGRSLSLTAGNQITTASAGSIATNNGAVSLAAANGIVLNHTLGINTNGGNLTFSNPVTLGASQTWNAGSGTITAAALDGGHNLTAAAGAFTLNGTLGGTTPLSAVSLTSAGALTLPSITASTILARSTGAAADLTIAAGKTLTATANSGDSLVLVAGRNFINLSSSSALATAGSARWLVYSTDAPQDTPGGLTPAFSRYSSTYAGYPPGSVVEAGSGFLYSAATAAYLTFTADDKNKVYGATNPAFTYTFFCSTGCTEAQAVTGAPSLTTSATNGSAVGNYTITTALGTLSPTGPYAGYVINLVNGTLAVTQKALSVLGVTANNKTYDGTATATLSTAGAALSGVVGGDAVTLDGSGHSASFADKAVGTAKAVTASGFALGGAAAGNYSLVQPTGLTADIAAKNLTVTGTTADNKTYDGTAAATLNTGSAGLSGVIGGDTVTLNTGAATAAFGNKNVGTAKPVTTTGFALSGADAGNYALTQPTTTADITAKALSILGVTAGNKTYDGTTTATLNNSSATLSGTIGGDSVALNSAAAAGAFGDKNVGTAKAVTASGYALTGADAGNYALSQPAGLTADITAKTLTAGLTGGVTKGYDANTAATLAAGNYTLSGVVGADGVTLNNPAAGNYDTKTVGTGKSVSVSGLSISGSDAGNYQLASTSASGLIGTITKKLLSILGVTTANKTYDATTTAALNSGSASLSGVVSGDTVTLDSAAATGAFGNKNVGTAKAVTAGGFALSGADASNYDLTQPTGLTADITAKSVSVTGVGAANKAYDGTTAATITGTATLSGAIGGDAVALTSGSASAAFADKTAAVGKSVSFGGYALTGADSGNYSLTQPVSTTATIFQKFLTVLGVTAANKTYDGTAAVTLNTGSATLSGVIGGDTITLDGATAAGAFGNKTVGTAKLVTTTGFAITGADSGNYALTQPTTTADITAKAVSILGVTAQNKTYDGTTTATLNSGAATLSGTIGGDTVALNSAAATGTFSNTHADVNKAVTASGYALTGADAGNYALAQPTGLTADITKKVLNATVQDKTLVAGVPTPVLSANNPADVLWAGFAGGDNAAQLTSATFTYGGATPGQTDALGTYALGLTALAAADYDLGTVTGGVLTISAAPVTPPAAPPSPPTPPVITPPVVTPPVVPPPPVTPPPPAGEAPIPAPVLRAISEPPVLIRTDPLGTFPLASDQAGRPAVLVTDSSADSPAAGGDGSGTNAATPAVRCRTGAGRTICSVDSAVATR